MLMGIPLAFNSPPQPQRHPFRRQQGLRSLGWSGGADCMGVQEVKAQAADLAGRFEDAGRHARPLPLAEKKGYSGVGLYSRKSPAR
jgi:exodeoxyribonuclease-3